MNAPVAGTQQTRSAKLCIHVDCLPNGRPD